MAGSLICECLQEFVMCLSVAAGLTTAGSHTRIDPTPAFAHKLSLLTGTLAQILLLTQTLVCLVTEVYRCGLNACNPTHINT